MKNAVILFSCFLVLCLVNLHGQQRVFEHYGLPEGLPQETVNCIDHDQYGFLWFGTSDGVYRFDGTDFYTPPVDDKTNLDLSGWRVGSLLVNNNIVYCGTGQKGLLAYDFLKKSIKSIGLQDSNCSALTATTDGILVGYYNSGIGYINAKNEFNLLEFTNAKPIRIRSIKEFGNKIYIGTETGELFWFPKNELNKSESIELRVLSTENAKVYVLNVIEDELYLGTNKGIFKLKENNFHKVKIRNKETDYGNYVVKDIVGNTDNIFIASTAGLIEGQFNKSKSEINVIEHYEATDKYNPYSISTNLIVDLDIHNNILSIGHITLDQTEIKNTVVFESLTDKYDLENPSVFGIVESEKNLWIGARDGLIIENKSTSEFAFIKGMRARSIIDDTKGNVWVGTRNGIFVFSKSDIDYESPNYKSVKEISIEKDVMKNPDVRHLYVDNNNDIWLVTYKEGVLRFSGNLNEDILNFEPIAYKESIDKLPSPHAINICQDQSENYWITTQKGLSKLTLDSNGGQNFKNYGESDGLATNGVLNVFVSQDGNVWVASRKGLNKYLPDSDLFTFYNKRDGLSNTFIYNILEDKNNNLWLSTNGGLFRFDPKKVQFSNYTPKDGIQSTEYNIGCAFLNNDGLMYFGGISGLDKFIPETVDVLDKESDLRFTAFRSKQKEIQNTNSLTNKLDVRYDAFPLDISFAALDYRPNKNIQYQYRLVPNNNAWTNLNDKNQIQFLNLPFGEHTLEIQGVSRGISWTGNPLTLDIKVIPPWYKSNLAYLLYFLTFLGIVYAFYSISLQRQIAGQESMRLQELDDLKSRFITNITHEFRTPLTIILGYLGNLKERFNGKTDVTISLDTIEQNSNNLLNLVNQMLDLAKLEKGQLNINLVQNDIVVFASNIANSFTSVAQDKGVNIEFVARPNEITMDFDPEKIRQILTNLLSNAIKFSPKDSQIRVLFEKKNDQNLCIKIKDEGYGISETELPFIFDRFYQVENAEHKITQGTGVGLALTKELIELFKGRINVNSEVNKGTTFEIELPISNHARLESIEAEEREITIGTVVPQIDDVISDDDANSVLIVEDNSDMARYIASCLKPEYKVTFAKDGKEGFNLATTTIPDIIITDVMMPIMDGFELTKALQGDSNTNHIPIIMLTSKAMQEDRLEGITSGVDAYLNKPFQKKELQLRIQMLIAKRRQLQERYSVNTVVEKKIEQPKPQDKKLIFLNSVIDAIHQHLDNSNFGATELANYLAMSDSQLYRKLKAITNTSTAVFIRKVRLEKGKELIDTTEMTISEIAYSTGFNDPNWFSKSFKEEFKQSPSSLRN